MAPKPTVNGEDVHAKLFWNGRSQAVRLPKEFRFVGDRVGVRRMGAGVLLEPVKQEKRVYRRVVRADRCHAQRPDFP